MIVWQSESAKCETIAARVAIAGDFLPAGNLTIQTGSDWRGIAAGLAAHFEDVAASLLNLECALDVAGLVPRPLAGIGQIVSAPEAALEFLDAIHAQAVGIANNHCYDFGTAGVQRTRDAILRRGMRPLGAGQSLKDEPEVFVWEGPGEIRVGFWAAATATLDPATRRTRGVEPSTPDRALRALEIMKNRGAQFCVALLHAGCMRTNRPDPEQVELMDSLARCGFRVVASSHSHRIAGYKRVAAPPNHPSFCFYGLGSLVSGYVSSPLEREGLIVVIAFNPRGEPVHVELRPVILGEDGFGKIPAPEMSQTILTRFQRLSEEIANGSFERHFYQDMSQNLLRFYVRDARTAFRESGVRGLARKASRVRMRHVRLMVHKVIG